MRVYELAAKIGTTSQTVMRLAEENDVEVYSPLSTLESDEVETLNAALLKVGVEKLKADAESARDRRMNKARRALKAAEEANRIQADELEANRQRAIAAYKEKGGDIPMPETKKAPVAAAKKPVKEEIKLDLPEGPKVKFEVSAEGPEDADAPVGTEADDFDDDDDDCWLEGQDRKAGGGTWVDLSGRSCLGYALEIPTEKVGSFDTELVEEFFYGFVRNCPCSLHIQQLAGSNSHHIIEGAFKAAARAIGEACSVDERFASEIPSTKGVL